MLPGVKILDYQRNGVKLYDTEVFFTVPILQTVTKIKPAKPRQAATS